MHDPKHPIWPILRLAVMMSALTAVLYFTAQHFDETELRTLIGMFLAGSLAEGLPALIGRFTKKDGE